MFRSPRYMTKGIDTEIPFEHKGWTDRLTENNTTLMIEKFSSYDL